MEVVRQVNSGSRHGQRTELRDRLDAEPMWRLLLAFLLPLIASNALQSISQLAGSIIIGRFIGVNAFATISGFFPVYFFLFSFMIGIGSGSSVLIGQASGAGNDERVREIIGTTITFTVLLSVALALAGWFFGPAVLALMGTPANILPAMSVYARIMFAFAPVTFTYIVYTTFLRGSGDSTTPLYFLVLSTVLNIALMLAFITGWGPFSHLGVTSLAWSTVISAAVALVALIATLYLTGHPLRFDARVIAHLGLNWRLLQLVAKIGIPSSIQMIIVSLAEIAVLSMVNSFGSHATAAYGAVNQVASYVQMPAVSLSIASSIFGAQLIGARRIQKFGDLIRTAITLNYIIDGALVAAVYLFSPLVLSLFITDPSTLQVAHELLMITLWSYLVFGHSAILSGIMRSSGVVLWPTAVSVGTIALVEVPVAYWMSHVFGLAGIWIGYPAAFAVNLGLKYLYYRLAWKHMEIKELAA